MADGLKLAQLSTLLAQQGMQGAAYNPGMQAYLASLIGSGQSATMAEAQKKAEKKKSDGTWGKILGTGGTIVGGVFGGPAGAAAGGALGNAAGQMADGGDFDFSSTATAGMSGAMSGMSGMKGTEIPGSIPPADYNVNPIKPNPTAPGAPGGGQPLADPASNTGMAGASGAPAPSTTNMPGGDGGSDYSGLMKYAPLLGAGAGLVAGGRNAYTQPVSASPAVSRARTMAPSPMGGNAGLKTMAPIRAQQFATMDPRQMRNLSEGDQQLLGEYLQGGNSLTPEQAQALPRQYRKLLQKQGYSGMPQQRDIWRERLKAMLLGMGAGGAIQGMAGSGSGRLEPSSDGTYNFYSQ